MPAIRHNGDGYNGAPGGEFIRVGSGEVVDLPGSACEYLLTTFPGEWEPAEAEALQDGEPTHTRPEPHPGKRPARPRKRT